ncbi:hypothetical protein DFH09DRAFT_1366225 [Mycena vulgaris]|nr:hypothetical protein DFH09DRAFT_1366225 [Mycena vulgaris]
MESFDTASRAIYHLCDRAPAHRTGEHADRPREYARTLAQLHAIQFTNGPRRVRQAGDVQPSPFRPRAPSAELRPGANAPAHGRDAGNNHQYCSSPIFDVESPSPRSYSSLSPHLGRRASASRVYLCICTLPPLTLTANLSHATPFRTVLQSRALRGRRFTDVGSRASHRVARAIRRTQTPPFHLLSQHRPRPLHDGDAPLAALRCAVSRRDRDASFDRDRTWPTVVVDVANATDT